MTLRIYDIFTTDPMGEFSSGNWRKLKCSKNLYNPSNLGGGYSRTEDGGMALNNESITFDVVFKTDVNSTGYEKYLDTVRSISGYKLVWLRYAVPITSGNQEYKYVYRPGYISGITKTEAKYNDASLVEKITVQTISGWFELYSVSLTGDHANLSRKSPNVTPAVLFNTYSKGKPKSFPITYPYWYGSLLKEITLRDKINKVNGKKEPGKKPDTGTKPDTDTKIQKELEKLVGDRPKIKRLNGTSIDVGTWYTPWGSPLSTGPISGVFAIHAPKSSISELERKGLGTIYEPFDYQLNRIKGPGFASDTVDLNDPQVFGDTGNEYTARNIKNRKPDIFKAEIANYSDNYDYFTENPDKDIYESYYIEGYASKNTTLGIGVYNNKELRPIGNAELTCYKAGYIQIDTAPWCNNYTVGGSSVGIDFSRWVKTFATGLDTVYVRSGSINNFKMILRRGVIGV